MVVGEDVLGATVTGRNSQPLLKIRRKDKTAEEIKIDSFFTSSLYQFGTRP
jgi:hypothetical protein